MESRDTGMRAWVFLTADAAFATLLLLILTLSALRGVVEMGKGSGFVGASVGPPAATTPVRSSYRGVRRVDPNRAGVEQLAILPGIGPALASAIVRFREAHGPFRGLVDLERVPEIGPARLRQIRAYLTLDEGGTWSTR